MRLGNKTFTQAAAEAAATYEEHGGKIEGAMGGLAYLMLIATEVSEAAEEIRRGRYYGGPIDYAKPEGLPSELADIVIRTMVLAEALGINLEDAIIEKQKYNKTRPPLSQEGKCL